MSTRGSSRHKSRTKTTNRFNPERGRGSANTKRPYFNFTRYPKKRSRTNIPNIFLESSTSSISISASATTCFRRPEFFTAPVSISDGQLQIIPIANPVQYPGWRLYFPTDVFKESSVLNAQIKAFEKHIKKNPNIYDLRKIRERRWFHIRADILLEDCEFVCSWIHFKQQIQESPNSVLSCLGVAMHRLVTVMTIESVVGQENNSRSEQYYSRKALVRKIVARPIDFCTVSSVAGITSESYDRLFAVRGRVSCISAVESKCTWVAYKCKRCGHEQAIRQVDLYPTKPLRCHIQCNSKRNFTELRSSPYTKIDSTQMIQLLESELCNEFGSPLRIDIELQKDLVNVVSPGSLITATGVLRIKSLEKSINPEFSKGLKQDVYMQAVNIFRHENDKNIPRFQITQKDLETVQMINREPNCLRLLVQSLAPEMCGHEMAKAAVLLSLFGGSNSQSHDEGEVNVLLVGDPGVGKSKLLQNVVGIAETGKLASGKTPIQFIATVQQSTCSNNNSFIDTGCILISQNGHCCIDDMDKFLSNQENLIHILQTKSVIVRSTNTAFNVAARTNVLSAINPVGGHYDSSKHLCENIRLNPSLLSLFHLVFVLFDKADKDRDNTMVKYVLHSGMKKVLSIPPKASMEQHPNNGVVKNNIELQEELRVGSDEKLDLLPTVLLKRFIVYARQNIKPLLTEVAVEEIKEFYLALRSEQCDNERHSITTRQLEALIRLTQARARIDLCTEATLKHACDAIEIMRHSTNTFAFNKLNTTLNSSIAGTSQRGQVKKFIQMLHVRSNALGRKIFEFEELKDMASHGGIKCGVTNLIELVNTQGYLLKKGPNLYEVITQ